MKNLRLLFPAQIKWGYVVLILFAIIYFAINFFDHYYFRTVCYDYGNYNFAFFDFAHFRVSDCTIYGLPHINFLQDHVSFLLFLFIPFYWIFGWLTGTYTLLFIQTVFILYGGWAVYKLIEFKTTEKYFPLLALILYLGMFGRWPSFIMDCNFMIFAASMVPVFFYYFEKKKFLFAALSFVFILISREDMALWTLFIGLFFLLSYYNDKEFRLAALLIIFISIFYFVLVFKIIIPLLGNAYKEYRLFNYSALGSNPAEAIFFIIKHPFETLKLFFINQSGKTSNDGVKFEFYYVYFLCGGFLLFRRPRYFLIFIPMLAKKMLNDDPVRWGVELYYSIEFVSFLPVAVFMILSEEKNRISRYILTVLVCLSTLTITVVKLNGHSRIRDWWGDKKFAFYKSSFYKPGFDVRQVYKDLSLIPSDARVSVSGTIVPHLAFRQKIYNFPRVADAEYIIVFKKGDIYPYTQEKFDMEVDKYRMNVEWNAFVDDTAILILKKKVGADLQ